MSLSLQELLEKKKKAEDSKPSFPNSNIPQNNFYRTESDFIESSLDIKSFDEFVNINNDIRELEEFQEIEEKANQLSNSMLSFPSHQISLEDEDEEELASSTMQLTGDGFEILQLLSGQGEIRSQNSSPTLKTTTFTQSGNLKQINSENNFNEQEVPPLSETPTSIQNRAMNLFSTIGYLKNETQTLSKDLATASKSSEALEAEVRKLHSLYQGSQQEIENLQKLKKNIEKDKDKEIATLNEEQVELKRLVSELENTLNERSQNNHMTEDFNHERVSLENTISNLQIDCNNYKSDIEKFRSDAHRFHEDNVKMHEEIQGLRDQLDSKNKFIDQLNSQIKKGDEIVSELHREIGSFGIEKDKLENENHTLRCRIASLEGETRTLHMEVASLRAQINSHSSFNQYQSHIHAPIPPPPQYNIPPNKHTQHQATVTSSIPLPPPTTNPIQPSIPINNSYSQPYVQPNNHSSSTPPSKSNFSQGTTPYATTTNKYTPTTAFSNSPTNIKSLSNLQHTFEPSYNQTTNPKSVSSSSSSSSLASLLNSKKINNTTVPLPSSTTLPIMQQQSIQLQILDSNLTAILREKEKLIEEQDRITMSGTSGRTLTQKQKVISINQRLSEIEKEATSLRNQIKNLNY